MHDDECNDAIVSSVRVHDGAARGRRHWVLSFSSPAIRIQKIGAQKRNCRRHVTKKIVHHGAQETGRTGPYSD